MFTHIKFYYIGGWQYNIVQTDKNKFCILHTNIKEKRGKHGEPIKEGVGRINPEECFKTLEEAEKYIEELKKIYDK